MTAILATILFCTLPHESPRVLAERVETVEINNFYDLDGKQVFAQLIFRDQGQIIAWRFPKSMSWSYHPSLLVLTDEAKVRIIVPDSVVESWTQFDPEQEARGWLPCERRRGLRGEKR